MTGNDNSLNKLRLSGWLAKIEAKQPDVSQHDIDFFVTPYQQHHTRYYHDHYHRAFMADEEFILREEVPKTGKNTYGIIAAIAKQGHDLVIMHIDGMVDPERAVSLIVANKISCFATWSKTADGFVAKLSDDGKKDEVSCLVANIFGINGNLNSLLHNKGANEFLSALATAKFMEEKGVPLKYIAAVAQNIAVTYPFQSSSHNEQYPYKDGYIGALHARLTAANTTYNLGMSDEEINWVTCHSVQTANRDISDFHGGDWIKMVHNTLKLNAELNPILREGSENRTIQDTLATSGPGFYELIKNGRIPAENIPHAWRGFTGYDDDHAGLVTKTKESIEIGTRYLACKKVGIALCAALAAFIGEKDARVPGFVRGSLWAASQPEGKLETDPADKVFLALRDGRGEGTGIGGLRGYEIPQSPVAGFIYEKIGAAGMQELYEKVRDIKSFSTEDREPARNYINAVAQKIGNENLKTILNELARVAEHPNKDWAGGENIDRAKALRNVTVQRLVSTAQGHGLAPS